MTLLRAITREWGVPLLFVEGNAGPTPARLLGHHDPSRVLREDYTAENFTKGPLVGAMRTGGFLYMEEFNRAPEDTLNTLLTAMAERQVAIPRVGVITALESFRVIASMNPFDNVGTTRLSATVRDRICRLAVGYQDAGAGGDIASRRTARAESSAGLGDRLVQDAVALTRATRVQDDLRQGSSVRGAIDLTLVTGQLLEMTGVSDPADERYRHVVFDGMAVALSGRIYLDETAEITPEGVLRRTWEDHFILEPAAADPG